VDVGNRQVVISALSQSSDSNAFRQLQVRQVDDLIQFNGSHVDFDELRQIFRQAVNFHFSHGVGDNAAFLDACTAVFVNEVQRDVDGHFVAGNNAQEVSVHDYRLGRVTLQCFQQHVFFLAVDGQADDVGVESFVFQGFFQFACFQSNVLRSLVTTVNDGGNQISVTTQAAARTFPQVSTRFRIKSEVDDCSLLANSPGHLRPTHRVMGDALAGC